MIPGLFRFGPIPGLYRGWCRGTSLKRNGDNLGPYSRTKPRAKVVLGDGAVSYKRGTLYMYMVAMLVSLGSECFLPFGRQGIAGHRPFSGRVLPATIPAGWSYAPRTFPTAGP
jgi:hypothetical protein